MQTTNDFFETYIMLKQNELGFYCCTKYIAKKKKTFLWDKTHKQKFPSNFFFKRVTIIKPEKKVNQWRIKEFLPFGMKIEVIVHVFQ